MFVKAKVGPKADVTAEEPLEPNLNVFDKAKVGPKADVTAFECDKVHPTFPLCDFTDEELLDSLTRFESD